MTKDSPKTTSIMLGASPNLISAPVADTIPITSISIVGGKITVPNWPSDRASKLPVFSVSFGLIIVPSMRLDPWVVTS